MTINNLKIYVDESENNGVIKIKNNNLLFEPQNKDTWFLNAALVLNDAEKKDLIFRKKLKDFKTMFCIEKIKGLEMLFIINLRIKWMRKIIKNDKYVLNEL